MISYPLQVNAVATRVLESGSAGTPIVLVHGAGGRADRWVRNLDALAAAGYRAYAFDLPGHGFAAKGAGVECSVPAYRRMLSGLMDAIGTEQAVMISAAHAPYYQKPEDFNRALIDFVGRLSSYPANL